MRRQIKSPAVITQYEAVLGLSWPVTYWVDLAGETQKIHTDPKAKTHEVWLTEGAAEDPLYYYADLIHELYHAYLAEKVDPAFSTVYFSKEYGRLEGEAAEEFSRKAHLLYLAYCHVDIWVNDARHQLSGNVTAADLISYRDSFVGMVNAGLWDVLSQPETVFGLAQAIAEACRYGWETLHLESFTDLYDAESRKMISTLLGVYMDLPWLSFNRAQDLKTLEESVQIVAARLSLPIVPRLVEEDEQMVWRV